MEGSCYGQHPGEISNHRNLIWVADGGPSVRTPGGHQLWGVRRLEKDNGLLKIDHRVQVTNI